MADYGVAEMKARGSKHAAISSSASSITAITLSNPNAFIRVLALHLDAGAAGAIVFKSGTTAVGYKTWAAASTELSHTLQRNGDGWFDCNVGDNFIIANASTLSLVGEVVYVEIG